MASGVASRDIRRREIALLALDVFASKGFSTASIADVAEAAGIGKGTLYEYFRSKDELLSASLLEWLEQTANVALRISVALDDPSDRLRAFVKTSTGALVSDERTGRMAIALFQAMLTGELSSQHIELCRRLLGSWRVVISDILRDGAERGAFRPDVAHRADTLALNIVAFLDGISMHYFVTRAGFDLDESVAQFLDTLLNDIGSKRAG